MTDAPHDDARTASKGKAKGAKKATKAKAVPKAAIESPAFVAEAAQAATNPPPPRPEAAQAEANKTTETGGSGPRLDFLSEEQRQNLEKLSMNLARAAMTAQGAIAEAALRSAERPAALSPDPFHVAPALNEVMSRLAGQPDRLMRAQADLFQQYMDLWQSAARRAQGETPAPVAVPGKGDKRFLDKDWTENPVYDAIKQSYLITSNWLNGLVNSVDNVDPLTKRRVEFFTQMLTDALSPSNFLLSNPAALREAMETHGQSLVAGMQNFADDLQRGGGKLNISQTDFEQFEVGRNVATAPGKVIFQNRLIQILQFTPTTETVCEIPLLIFPPWINKFYILDLRPENSMIRWLTDQGISVFVTSWVNPDATLAEATFEDYMKEGVYAAVEAVTKQANVETVNTVGYCIGGTMLSSTLAHMAHHGDKRIASATFFAAQQDFSEAGDLLIFTSEAWLKDLEAQMDAGGGVLSGQTMAETFNALRGNDLIWSFFVNNYLMGKEPRPFDLLFWNADQTRMPRTLHLFYLRKFYGENALAKGELVVDNVRLNLADVKTPIFVQSSREDHIAPYRSVYKGAKLFGGPVEFMMAGSGHIAGVINAPVAKKYQHWVNHALPSTVEEWMAGAEERPGSWWEDWVQWLGERCGPLGPPPTLGNDEYPPQEAAPGQYVLQS